MSATKYNNQPSYSSLMWYLIIPPVIVVVSLSFVLWYLSRKRADPVIAERASQLVEETQEQISFLRTKNFFLRVLEKTAYRFKVVSLQAHNILHNLTQRLKVRRQRFQEEILAKKSEEHSKVPEQMLAPRQSESVGTSEESQPISILQKTVPQRSIPSFRPMVSETITHPETIHEKTPADISREESLIARIAVDPKDFVAYEGLGDYYLEIGNVEDAKECYRQVLKLSPLHRIVKIKIHRLEKILSEKV